jgi:hypothetical protein
MMIATNKAAAMPIQSAGGKRATANSASAVRVAIQIGCVMQTGREMQIARVKQIAPVTRTGHAMRIDHAMQIAHAMRTGHAAPIARVMRTGRAAPIDRVAPILHADRSDQWAAGQIAISDRYSPGSIWTVTTCSAAASLPSCRSLSTVAALDRRAVPTARASADVVPIGRSVAKAIGFKPAFAYGASKARLAATRPARANVTSSAETKGDPIHHVLTIQRARLAPHRPVRPRPRRFETIWSLVSTRSRVNRPPSRHGAGSAYFCLPTCTDSRPSAGGCLGQRPSDLTDPGALPQPPKTVRSCDLLPMRAALSILKLRDY